MVNEIKFLHVHAIGSFSFSSLEILRDKKIKTWLYMMNIEKKNTLKKTILFSLVVVILCTEGIPTKDKQQKTETLCLSGETSYGRLTRRLLYGMLLLTLIIRF